jgi:hypothetical protein
MHASSAQIFFHDPDHNMIEVCNCDELPIEPIESGEGLWAPHGDEQPQALHNSPSGVCKACVAAAAVATEPDALLSCDASPAPAAAEEAPSAACPAAAAAMGVCEAQGGEHSGGEAQGGEHSGGEFSGRATGWSLVEASFSSCSSLGASDLSSLGDSRSTLRAGHGGARSSGCEDSVPASPSVTSLGEGEGVAEEPAACNGGCLDGPHTTGTAMRRSGAERSPSPAATPCRALLEPALPLSPHTWAATGQRMWATRATQMRRACSMCVIGGAPMDDQPAGV